MLAADLMERMSASELAEWMAMDRINGPGGEDREDIRQAYAAMITASCHGLKNAKLKDFLVCVPKPELSEDEIAAQVKGTLRGV